MKREIIYHHGPTNAGKTFSALKDFSEASSGIYCAPLRLLAWEIHEKMEQAGKKCNLITGQEKILFEDANLTSCTIETANINKSYSVAIIVKHLIAQVKHI